MMNKFQIIVVLLLLVTNSIFGQIESRDSTKIVNLEEVIVIGNDGLNNKKDKM